MFKKIATTVKAWLVKIFNWIYELGYSDGYNDCAEDNQDIIEEARDAEVQDSK